MKQRRNIAFWVASGQAAGRGHLARSLPLAAALAQLGWHPRFLLDRGGCYNTLVAAAGFQSIESERWNAELLVGAVMATSTPWLITDRHGISSSLIVKLHQAGLRTVGLSVVGDGVLSHDLLINPNAHRQPKSASQQRISGADALLLDRVRLSHGDCQQVDILVTLGGSLMGREATIPVAVALMSALPQCTVAATVPHRYSQALRIQQVQDDRQFTALMRGCHIVVCGFGTTVYEAAFLGKAIVTVALNSQQRENAEQLLSWGIFDLCDVSDTTAIVRAVATLWSDDTMRNRREQATRLHVDGRALEHCAEHLSMLFDHPTSVRAN